MRNASNRTAADMFIENTTYLLAQAENGVEYVTRYDRDEISEVFTAAELEQLAAGEVLLKQHRGFAMRYVDMVGTARAARQAG